MTRVRQVKTTFTSGEVSRSLLGRADLRAYANGALALRNVFIQPTGGIHQPGTLYRNYETCLSILCFQEANKDGRYDEVIKKADAFIKGIQGAGPSQVS